MYTLQPEKEENREEKKNWLTRLISDRAAISDPTGVMYPDILWNHREGGGEKQHHVSDDGVKVKWFYCHFNQWSVRKQQGEECVCEGCVGSSTMLAALLMQRVQYI